MVFDADHQAFFVCLFGDFLGLRIFEDERLYAADMLIVFECGLYDGIVQLVGDGSDDYIMLWHLCDDLFEHIGEFFIRVGVERGICGEALVGVGFLEHFIVCKVSQWRAVEGAYAYVPDKAGTLKLVDGRQNLDLGYHTAADDTDLWLSAHLKLLLSFGINSIAVNNG
jgi:hypothetical protein